MSALLTPLAHVSPNALTKPFWDACRRRELRIQRCEACGRFRHPPLSGCPYCGSTNVEWRQVSGEGRIFSYTVVHHPAMPSLAETVPYVVVVVTLDDAPGVHLISNVLDVAPDAVTVDAPVTLAWDELGDVVLPRFRLRT